MYNENVEVKWAVFITVFIAISLLEMEDTKVKCTQIIDGRDEIRIYFYTYVLSKKLRTQHLRQRALKLITHRFEESVFSKEFIQLDLDYVLEILSAHEIGARSEVIVFLAALNWLNYDYGSRRVNAVTVMKCVRFSLMTMEEIVACYHPPFLPHVVQIPEVMMMLFRATSYIAAKSQGQETWFKEYASPKRILTLKSLPLEIWNKRLTPRSFAATDPQRVDVDKKIENKESSRKLEIDSAFSRLLRDPVEVIAGNTGQENKYMEERKKIRTKGYDFQVLEDDEDSDVIFSNMDVNYDSQLNGLPAFPGSSISSPPAGQLLRNLMEPKEFNEEYKFDYGVGKFYGKKLSKTFMKYQRGSMFNDLNDIQYIVPEQTKIIHLSRGPQICPSGELKVTPKDEQDLKKQLVPRTGAIIMETLPQDKPKIAKKAPLSDNQGSLKTVKESSLKKDTSKTDLRKDELNHEKIPVLSDKKTSSKGGTKEYANILVVGGMNMNPTNLTKDTGGEILILDSKSDRWIYYNKIPESRHNHCAAFLDNCLYIIGGCNHEDTIKNNRYIAKRSCFKLDLKNVKWRLIAKMECCRYDHGLVTHNGNLYAIGGQDRNGRLLKSVEVFDPKRNRWRFLQSSMCCGRKAMGVAVFGDRIWIVGGLTESGKDGKLQVVSHVDCYHPGEKKWYFNLYSLPGPRCFCCLAAWEGRLYCLGGMVCTSEGKTRATDEVWFVNNEHEIWQTGPNLPRPRLGGVALNFKRSLYYLGGHDPDSNSNDGNISILTQDKTSWDTGPHLPFPLFGLSAVSFRAA